jgi:catechol 2,3-dioxygenase-like lactoylglutathione lyase family enzyme
MIRRIVLAGIWVNDQDAARKFYVETLGFKLQTDILWKLVTDGLKLFL